MHAADHFREHQQVVEETLAKLGEKIAEVANLMVQALRGGKKLIAFGNGGSATQASHLAGELLGRFSRQRQPLPAIALCSDPAVVTCIANDYGYDEVFARQIIGLAQVGDVVIGLTTSGISKNVERALAAARECGAITIALTGAAGMKGGKPHHVLEVPTRNTAHVQEVHLMILHILCKHIDEEFSGGP
jgi:D-sedoheptulose 7-phosphate isomerase